MPTSEPGKNRLEDLINPLISLQELLIKRKELTSTLADIEREIYAAEGYISILQDTVLYVICQDTTLKKLLQMEI